MMREDNARSGFFEHAEFLGVAAHLPDPINDIALFGYLSGWRKGEILSLRWDMVDRSAKEVRIRTAKNGQGRVLPLRGDLWDLIERRWTARRVEKKDGTTNMAAAVFHRGGVPVADFRDPWTAACKKARVPGKLFHDLRRTAVRNMIRSGGPQSIAMSISGHKTVSMFMRYNITSGADQIDALDKMAAHLSGQPTERNERRGLRTARAGSSFQVRTRTEHGQSRLHT